VKVGTRFIVALLMVLLPVMGAYMYWSVHRSTQSYVHDLERESRATARSLGAALNDDIRTNEWDQVDDTLERIRSDGTEAAVFGKDGKLWHALRGFPSRLALAPEQMRSARPDEPVEFRLDADPDGEWICEVVPLGPPKFPLVGYLLVANDWTDVRQDLSDRVRISILAGAATLVLIIVLIALAVRSYISRPLAELSRRVISFSTDESANGHPNHHDSEPVRDEVELLIGEFRKLGEELAKARADLLEKHRSEIELERRLLHSDRLATIGSLAAGLAHEIGTPMGVIRGRAEYLAHSKMEPLKTAEGLEIIIAQIDRITSIVRMLLDYSRYRESLKLTADLRPIVQRSIHLIETEATKRGVMVRTETGEQPLPIDCDPDQLQQVFVNLGINALDAMRATGGALTVRARTEHDNGAARVVVVFEDTGPGIPESNRGRIFDPFFTTKEPGEGTGMGLAVCQTIVQSHNGEITFESSPTGTRFFASFPRSHRSNSGSLETARTNGHANE
jgi:two-component system NtrC family sensor kinase